MELKQGCKKTEVGLLPNDWNVFQVIDLIDLLTDYDANGSFASVAENVNVFDKEDYAWYVRSTDLEKKSKLSDVRYVDEKSYKFLKKTALFGGELLFLKRGDIGNVYLFEKQTKFATVAPNLYLLKINKLTNPTYLFNYFKSNGGQLQLKSKNASSTLGALYKDDVKSIFVPLPPTLKEQIAIATALTDVDTLITNLDDLIAKKKAIKQGAMQQLLMPPSKGGKRLDGFNGEWVEKSLGDLGNCIIGLTYSPSDVASSGILVLRSSNIQNDQLTFDDNVYVQKEISQKLRTQIDDLLICVRNGSRRLIGKCARIDETCVNQTFGAFMSIYRSDYNKFISHVFRSYIIHKQIEENLGATINQITNKTLNSFKIWFPSDDNERKAIVNILDNMNDEIVSLQIKKEKYEQIKQGMMQELLTGKTRLV